MSISKKLMTVGGKDSLYVDDVFSTYVYTGTGADRDIENDIDLASEGGLVWIKDRDNVRDHALFDTERGINRYLNSNQTYVESQGGTITSYNEDGFSLFGNAAVNGSGIDYASWTFRKAKKFFDVVTWTGDGVAGREIPHNLGVEPGMIMVKSTTGAFAWSVYHRSTGSSANLTLNNTNPINSPTTSWNNTDPTDKHFTVGTAGAVNGASESYVAYLFAHDAQDFGTGSDESIIKCGSYTGNGSSNGPEIDLGFEPQWLMIKSVNASDNWYMFDTMRGIATGGTDFRLFANSSGVEDGASWFDVTSTGFHIKTTAGWANDNARDYIYMAIRRPNKPAKEFEPEELFNTGSGVTNADPSFQSNFVADMGIYKFITQVGGNYIQSRMNGNKYQETNSVAVETDASSNTWDWMNGFGEWRTNVAGAHHWSWRRAAGHFDVVTYGDNNTTGSYNSTTIPHNLGAVPQMIWIKMKEGTSEWVVWAEGFQTGTTSEYLFLEGNGIASNTGNNRAFTADPTEDNFTVGPWGKVNADRNYTAYLFASVPGISKIGRYTGTGVSQFIDCGFTNGPRFVLIKRVDGTGDWMVVDTERGFVGGLNPFIFLNSNAAQVNDFRVYPSPEGFVLSNDGSVSTVGAEYLFYAIA